MINFVGFESTMTNIVKISPLSLICVCAAFLFVAKPQVSAQQQDEDQALYEAVQKEVERYSRTLELDPAQEFYIDSILTHDWSAMSEELRAKSKAKVANTDIYIAIQDKWNEQTYNAFHAVLDEEQWAKYLKGGAAKEKKARDKRESKRQKTL